MSLSDRLIPSLPVSQRPVVIGAPGSALPVALDTRPFTVREAETLHARQLADLEVRHQAALEAAYRNGYNDGATMAQADAQKELERTSNLTKSLIAEFSRTRAEWCDTNEEQMVELVCVALEQVLGDRPPVAARILHALRRAFEQLDEGDRVTVRCHPDEIEFVRTAMGEPDDALNGSHRVQLVPDDGIQVGGCLVETDLGLIDARVEQQLRILRGALLDAGSTDTTESATLTRSAGEPTAA